jgi:hypothetical protein
LDYQRDDPSNNFDLLIKWDYAGWRQMDEDDRQCSLVSILNSR